MYQDETWRAVGLAPGHIVLFGDSAPPSPKGHSPTPIFGPHLCGQMARSIKMPLSRKAGLDSNDIVLDGDPAPYPKRAPDFWPMSVVAKWLDG